MSDLFKNKVKLMYFTFGILMFIVLVASLAYMTNYGDIHVWYTLENGQVVIDSTSMYPKTKATNSNLFAFFETNLKNVDMNSFTKVVFDYQVGMSSLNDYLIIFAVIGLICFAALLICSNHSRRVYYKSNLVCGIVAPLITFVLGIVAFVRNFMMMNVFNENAELFNKVAIIQNPDNQSDVAVTDIKTAEDVLNFVNSSGNPCNSITYIIFMVLFAIVMIYSIVLIVLAVKKYKDTTELRNEIIRRAVENNG